MTNFVNLICTQRTLLVIYSGSGQVQTRYFFQKPIIIVWRSEKLKFAMADKRKFCSLTVAGKTKNGKVCKKESFNEKIDIAEKL